MVSETSGHATAAHAERFLVSSHRGPADGFSSLHSTLGRGALVALMYRQAGSTMDKTPGANRRESITKGTSEVLLPAWTQEDLIVVFMVLGILTGQTKWSLGQVLT